MWRNDLMNRFVLQKSGDFTWRVSDFEELSGGQIINYKLKL